MKTILCRWCSQLATGTVTAKGVGPAITVPYCDQCWDRSYQEVRYLPHRSWKILDQPAGLF